MKKTIAIILSIMLVLAITLPATAISTIAVKGIKLNNSKITMKIGETSNLKATLTPTNTSQKRLTYVTGDKYVASIDATGKITGVHAGTTTIYVYSINKKIFAKCTVTISKPVKLTYYVPASVFNSGSNINDALNKLTTKKINAEVNLKFINFGEYDQKLSVIMGAGEKFDVCFTSSWLNNFYKCVGNGSLLPLDDLLDKYAPKTKASIPEATWGAAKVNGKLYAIINQQVWPLKLGVVIAKDIAAKYKFDVNSVKWIGDLEPLMAAIKKDEPKIKYCLPYSLMYQGYYYRWEDIGGPDSPGVINPDVNPIKVFNQFETPEYKKNVLLFRHWAEEGYIPMDEITNKTPWDQKKIYLAGTIVWKPGCEVDVQYGGVDRVVVPIGKPMLVGSFIVATMNAISVTSKNPESAMKFLELLNSDRDVFNLISYGIENSDYKKVGENRIELIPGSKYNSGPSPWAYGNTFNGYLLPGQADNTWVETQKYNESVPASVGMGFTLDTTPIKTEMANCSAVYNEYTRGFECGVNSDTEKTYAEFLDKLKKAGAEKVIAEKQRQIDAWVAAKKK